MYLKDLEISPQEYGAIEFWGGISQKLGVNIVLKGGFIRDKIANLYWEYSLQPADIDFLVPGNIILVVREFLNRGGLILRKLGRKGTMGFKLVIPSFPDLVFELGLLMGMTSDFNNPSFETRRRADVYFTDLDINSMSVSLGQVGSGRPIFDPLGGSQSIFHGESSLVSWKSLHRNPENVLRAVALSNRVGCRLSQSTCEFIKSNIGVVKYISRNFLLSQLDPIVSADAAPDLWIFLKRLGFVEQAFPENANISLDEVKQLVSKCEKRH